MSSKKRISLFMEGIPEPQIIAWYVGTPHNDILNTIRLVSLPCEIPHSVLSSCLWLPKKFPSQEWSLLRQER